MSLIRGEILLDLQLDILKVLVVEDAKLTLHDGKILALVDYGMDRVVVHILDVSAFIFDLGGTDTDLHDLYLGYFGAMSKTNLSKSNSF